ncbi:MAG TPA: dihydrolipoamide acetyltransferase family protein [Myxococcota bacterium]|nr:dihydrolipoamide acetyltransferase family protein [Myxococcota bacterium]
MSDPSTHAGERIFRLPDLGEGLQEAELLDWLVEVGARVHAGEPLARVETDKAQVDVASPWSGRVGRRLAEVGDRVRVGAPFVAFDEVEIEVADGTASTSTADEADFASERGADAGTVVGVLPGSLPLAAERADRGPSSGVGPGAASRPPSAASALRAVPAARARARELGVELASVRGTGPEGVITRADVERANGRVGLAGAGRIASVPVRPALPGAEPLRGVRLAMARRMARSGAEVVPASVLDEVDVEAWWREGVDVAARLVRAIGVACRAEPALNAWLDGAREARVLHECVDLGIAMETDEGLFAPVVRDIGRAPASRIRADIDRLARAARARTLEPDDLRGATITLSNFGTFGGCHATLVIVPPQVAIVGTGRIEPRVVAHDGRALVRATLPLSLGFDHRAVTGAEATRFLAALRADLARTD